MPPEPPEEETVDEDEGLPMPTPEIDEPAIPESMYDDQFPVDSSPYGGEAPAETQALPPSAPMLPVEEELKELPPAGEGSPDAGLDKLLDTPGEEPELTELTPLDEEGEPVQREKQLDNLFDGF